LCEEFRKLKHGFAPEELARARAQLKSGLLMSLEATSARVEQHASHMLTFGRPFDSSELIRRIDAVDDAAVARVVARFASAPPTFAALGPIGKVEAYERLAERLKA
jgi:predicted Zn-dependent peptidase